MADIDPYGQIQQYTPRVTTIVDAIAENKRVTEAAIRSNPLRNARVDDGLMVWRGNYAGQGGINDSYLWIGEVYPADGVLDKPQRGVFITRDDPKHARAFWMYDPGAEEANPVNRPLRQVVMIHDADDRPLMTEAYGGGAQFPYGQVPLYGTRDSYYNVRVDAGGTMKFLPVLGPNVVRAGGLYTMFRGYGPMTGHRLKCWLHGFSSTGSAVGGSWGLFLRINFNDGSPQLDTGRIDCPAGGSATFFWDLDFRGQNKVGKEVSVQVMAEMLSGSDEWCYAYPQMCYSYGE